MIDGGQFMFGRLVEAEIHGEAFAELTRIVLAWERPAPPWPVGTTFTEPRKEREWSLPTSWAFTPAGVWYELLVLTRDPDPREAPPVLWSILVAEDGTIYADPRIANMKVTLDPPHPVDEPRLADAYAGVPLGLARRYTVGRLSRALREATRVVSDGWTFAAAPT